MKLCQSTSGSLVRGIPEGEVGGAVEAALGGDVLAQQKIRDGRLVECVGRVDPVPAQVRLWNRAGRGWERRREVDELAVHQPGVAARHVLVEVVGASHSTACLQRRGHICKFKTIPSFSHSECTESFILTATKYLQVRVIRVSWNPHCNSRGP